MATHMEALALRPALAKIASGRDCINTREFAQAIDKLDSSVRRYYSTHGHAYGIQPRKVGGALLWPVSDVANLLQGGAK